METEVLIALIGMLGTVVTALISAYVATHKGESKDESRDLAVAEMSRRRDVRQIRVRNAAPKVSYRTSTGMLILRVVFALAICGGTVFAADEFNVHRNEALTIGLIVVIGIFALIAVASIFRLVYRFFWSIFVA